MEPYRKSRLLVFIIFALLLLVWKNSSRSYVLPKLEELSNSRKTLSTTATTYKARSIPISALLSSSVTKKCERKNNITFMKTHKTASTAVQNILLRYGLKYNLKFALPLNGHMFNYPDVFHKSAIAQQGPGQSNIICHHMRFNYNELKSFMPKDSVFFTILREPGKQFESIFDYYWGESLEFQQVSQHAKDSVERWLDNASDYSDRVKQSIHSHFSRNPTMFDLGFDNKDESKEYIASSIAKVDQMFDLVMISDHFSESLVLLADLLCWDLKEVACLDLNMRNTDYYNLNFEKRNRIQEKARKWNKADAALFDYFNATFWIKIKKYGHERMKKDVGKLLTINQHLSEKCIEGGKAVDYYKLKNPRYKHNLFKPKGVNLKAYNLKKDAQQIILCQQLIAGEIDFTKSVFNKQRLESP